MDRLGFHSIPCHRYNYLTKHIFLWFVVAPHLIAYYLKPEPKVGPKDGPQGN
jgi:hypothetical protein